MPAVLSRYDRSNTDGLTRAGLVPAVKTTTYSMTVRDHLLRVSTTAGAWTLTLPPVHEAAGQVYQVRVTAGAVAGAAPNAVTIVHAGDSLRWSGNYQLFRPGQMLIFISDGEEWNVSGHSIGRTDLRKRGFYERFEGPFSLVNANVGGVWNGTAGSLNMINMASGNSFLMHVKGTQTLLGPIWLNPGLGITQDLTDNDGIEYIGATVIGSGNPAQYVIGTDRAFFCRARVTIADVSGTDDFSVGFRIVAAGQANFDDYTDLAGIGLNNATGDIFIETILNNAATTSTDTTNNWADTETHTLSVFVSAAGVVTYQLDDAAPLVVAAFTFDAGDTVTPYIFFLNATTTPGAVSLLEWECNFQD